MLLLPFFSMDFFGMDYNFLTLKKMVVVVFYMICSLNPLKTCAWLQGSIWKPLKVLDVLPAPRRGPRATVCTTGDSNIQRPAALSPHFGSGQLHF